MRLPISPMHVQRPILVSYAESLAAVGLCTAVSVWLVPLDQVAAVVSLYLVAIILGTLRGGFWPGVVAAVASFLAFDYAFTPPLRTISVPEIADVAAFLIFVGAAGLVSHLVGRAQAEAAEARRRERAARLIADVAQAIGPVEDPRKLDEVVAAWAMRDLPIRGCLVMRPEGDGPPTVRVQMGDCPIPTDAELARLGRELAEPSAPPAERTQPGVRDLPMRAGDRVVGFVRLAADRTSELLDDEPVRVALTHHLGTAVERALLHAEATEAEVLRRSDELKSNLLSLVSHELRTPLTVIKTAATSLREEGLADDARGTLLGVIDLEANRLHHLVGNLLDLSRIDGGALRLQRDWYDLGELAREAVDRLRPALKGQRVDVEVAEDLAPVPLDYLLLDRVVENLVLNAIRYTPSEAPIRISVAQEGWEARLTVTDYGPGVPEADLSRIFERFYRREGPWVGAGLGLALCKAIVEAHGGRIWAAQTADGPSGLSVSVVLPLLPTPPNAPAEAEPKPNAVRRG